MAYTQIQYDDYYLSKDDNGKVTLSEVGAGIGNYNEALHLDEGYCYDKCSNILKALAEVYGYELVEEDETKPYQLYDIDADGEIHNVNLKNHLVLAYGINGELYTLFGELELETDSIYPNRKLCNIVSNKLKVLRDIAESVGFKYEPSWNANTLGSKLIDFLE